VASDRRKPGGLVVVPPGREASFLAPFDVRLLPGIGPRSEERLRRAGVETIGALAALPDEQLFTVLPGKVGRLLRDRANGIDPRGIEPPAAPVSLSQEETFERDISDRQRLHEELRRMAVDLAEGLQRRGYSARTVTTKLRYPHFARPAVACQAHFSDRIIAAKIVYRFRDPERGDIAVFKTPALTASRCHTETGATFVKRVVGLPGETISERTGTIYVNGRPLREPYVSPSLRDGRSGTWTVPKGSYFMLGDDRKWSCDSRDWGSVPRSDMIGPVVLTYWPPT